PMVNILSPAAGGMVGDTLTIKWAGSDPDGDSLQYIVRYSSVNGAHWQRLVPGTPLQETTMATQGLAGGKGAKASLVQVLASDGIHTASATVAFTLPRHAPKAYIFDEQGAPLDAA